MKKAEVDAVLKTVGEMKEEELQPILNKIKACKTKGVSIYQSLLDMSVQERGMIISTLVALLLYETEKDKRELATELLLMSAGTDLKTLDEGMGTHEQAH